MTVFVPFPPHVAVLEQFIRPLPDVNVPVPPVPPHKKVVQVMPPEPMVMLPELLLLEKAPDRVSVPNVQFDPLLSVAVVPE